MYIIRPEKKRAVRHWVLPDRAFDCHGHSHLIRLLAHVRARAFRWWPGRTSDRVPLPAQTLVSEEESRRHDGLWQHEPDQFLHDAPPRAHRFLDRFPPPTRRHAS